MRIGTFAPPGRPPRVGMLLPGTEHAVLDLAATHAWLSVCRPAMLRPIMRQPPPTTLRALLESDPDALVRVGELALLAVDAVPELPDFEAAEGGDEPVAYPLAAVSLLPPILDPPSVRDFYAFEQHVRGVASLFDRRVPPEWYEFPVFYFSNPAALFGPEADIPVPSSTQELDYELEVAVVISRPAENLTPARAGACIAGYTIMNDWSARDVQRREMRVGLGPAKAKDFATSLGPWLVTPDELADRRVAGRLDLAMAASVNGHQISQGNLRDLYWTFAEMLTRASADTILRPGDVIGSGTVGSGCLLEQGSARERWLQPGDVVELTVERLGTLRNRVVARRPAPR